MLRFLWGNEDENFNFFFYTRFTKKGLTKVETKVHCLKADRIVQESMKRKSEIQRLLFSILMFGTGASALANYSLNPSIFDSKHILVIVVSFLYCGGPAIALSLDRKLPKERRTKSCLIDGVIAIVTFLMVVPYVTDSQYVPQIIMNLPTEVATGIFLLATGAIIIRGIWKLIVGYWQKIASEKEGGLIMVIFLLILFVIHGGPYLLFMLF